MGAVGQGSLSRIPAPAAEWLLNCKWTAALPLQLPHKALCTWLRHPLVSNEIATCEVCEGIHMVARQTSGTAMLWVVGVYEWWSQRAWLFSLKWAIVSSSWFKGWCPRTHLPLSHLFWEDAKCIFDGYLYKIGLFPLFLFTHSFM